MIDFSDNPGQAGWHARLFMLAALGLFALSLARYSDSAARLDEAREHEETLAARLQQKPTTAGVAELGDAERQARLEESINLNWGVMLTAVERATGEDVAVTAIQADPKRRQVMVSGQARDYVHALDFVSRLADHKAFAKAYLVNHAVAEDDPDKPVDFTLEAEWITR